MENRISRNKSIVKHIIDGSIKIHSITEFVSILKIFPDNPALLSVFGDFLVRNKQFSAAAKSYRKASNLYMDSGMVLAAILMRIQEQGIGKSSNKQTDFIYATLRKPNLNNSPVHHFFKNLSYSETIAFADLIARVHLPANRMIGTAEDPDNCLYFIASGTVKETTHQPLNGEQKTHSKETIYLSENDIFGNVFPLRNGSMFQPDIETVTSVELGKVNGPRLIEVCKEYPNIIKPLIDLFKASSKKTIRKVSTREERITRRQSLALKMRLKILPKGSKDYPYVLRGHTKDISLRGVGIVLDEEYLNVTSSTKLLKNARVEVCFLGGDLTLNVQGTIVWIRRLTFEGKKIIALGLRFKEMTPKMAGMLITFANMLSENI